MEKNLREHNELGSESTGNNSSGDSDSAGLSQTSEVKKKTSKTIAETLKKGTPKTSQVTEETGKSLSENLDT